MFELLMTNSLEENTELRDRLGIKSQSRLPISYDKHGRAEAKSLNITLTKRLKKLEEETWSKLRFQALDRELRAVSLDLVSSLL
jgi:hypothetical protein